jgi:hypothetical protein
MQAIFWAGISAARASEPSTCNRIWQNGCCVQLAKNGLFSGTVFGKMDVSDGQPVRTLSRDRVNEEDEADVVEQPVC